MSSEQPHHPSPGTLTAEVHLLGGPLDGDTFVDVPFHVSAIAFPLLCAPDPSAPHAVFATGQSAHYVYCPHATARLGRQVFRHSTLSPELCAR